MSSQWHLSINGHRCNWNVCFPERKDAIHWPLWHSEMTWALPERKILKYWNLFIKKAHNVDKIQIVRMPINILCQEGSLTFLAGWFRGALQTSRHKPCEHRMLASNACKAKTSFGLFQTKIMRTKYYEVPVSGTQPSLRMSSCRNLGEMQQKLIMKSELFLKFKTFWLFL